MIAIQFLKDVEKLKIEVDLIMGMVEYISNATYLEDSHKIKIITKMKNDISERKDMLQKLDDRIKYFSVDMLKRDDNTPHYFA